MNTDVRQPDVDPQYTLDTGGVVRPILVSSWTRIRPWWNKFEQIRQTVRLEVGLRTRGVTPNGEVLHCWLAKHPEVRAHLIWENIQYTFKTNWGPYGRGRSGDL